MSERSFPPLAVTDASRFGRVVVLLGGDSSEREVSLKSGAAVLQALQSRGVDAHAVDGLPALLDEIRAGRVDRVFNILHGGAGENGVMQGVLDALKVPYTGSGVLGSALTMDKIRTKQVWIAEGLPTPKFVRLPGGGRADRGAELRAAAASLGYPVFVKPSSEGSSVGVFRVLTEADLQPAIDFALKYAGELLMEQMVRGDEFSVPVIAGRALPSIRIVPKGEWYDYNAKYVTGDTQYITPGLEGDDEAEIRRLAEAGFAAADCSGWGRVDVMRDVERGFQLIEVNTAPGMTATSLVPKSARTLGIEFDELCWRILEQTMGEAASA
ncbi:D-alanine--D-alanine ligase [Lysobacter oculi]|uniref:D-alanine--D-alanine ligase n=1 Tax=Solilutibacter oculi TaxID=2698682 RepID=A0A344J6J5_9GAMM|nr:D-alanine--D-alanine ligase [Lysobacter oculi]AXA84655.1 D-alanine--D-alanine ligase [Lysobacter oculi]